MTQYLYTCAHCGAESWEEPECCGDSPHFIRIVTSGYKLKN